MCYTIRQRIKWKIKDFYRASKNLLVLAKYKINGGYVCTDCGAIIPIHYDSIFSKVNGKTFMIMNLCHDLVCPHCLLEKIEEYFAMSEPPEHRMNCDWYPDKTQTISCVSRWDMINAELADSLDLDIRFGGMWWNGHHASIEAFHEALTSPLLEYRTNVWTYDNDKECGIMVDRNGIKHCGDFISKNQ